MKIEFKITIDGRLAALCRKIFTVKTVIFLVAVCLFTMGLFLFSEQITKPYTFISDTVISSAEVNENFDALYTLINQHDTSIKNLQQGGGTIDGEEFYMVPRGAIIMWSGTLASIPSGWQLCNGIGGTPDLCNRFIYGVASAENPGVIGGASTYTLTVGQLPPHNHPVNDPGHRHAERVSGGSGTRNYYTATGYSKSENWSNSAYTGITIGDMGSGDVIDNRPAYFKLAFIMKL